MIKVIDEHLGKKIDYASYKKEVVEINKMIEEKTGPGNDYLGWLNYPTSIKESELDELQKYAEIVRKNYDILLVCGIGGSYLGARAAIEAINGLHSDKKPEIIFVGQSFSSDYLHEVIEHLEGKKFAINVISKSGTTTETSIAFRILKNLLEEKVGKKEAAKAIFATTDKEKGALLKLSKQEGYVKFVLPSDIGGRFSVFSAVGLFPIACAGIDIKKLIEGAKEAEKSLKSPEISENSAYKYAVIRDALYREKYADELFVSDPFAGEEKPKPKQQPPKSFVEPVPQIVIQPLPQPVEQPKPQEKIILTGTAISGENKTAMFLRDKETLFLTVGEEIGGKKILDISVDFVMFEDGQKVYLQKELR